MLSGWKLARSRNHAKRCLARSGHFWCRAVPPVITVPYMSAGSTARPVRVAVVVVSYESADVIEGCLRSIPKAARGVELVSVVVVDNSSTDDSIQRALGCLSGVRIVRAGGNLGYAAGVNLGHAASAPHECLLVLNPDTVLKPGAVGQLAAALQAGGSVGMAVPRLTDLEGRLSLNLRTWPSLLTAASEAILGGRLAGRMGLGEVVSDPRRYLRPGPVDWATGAAVMISSACWQRLGPWDESFFLYSEETEYMLRAHQAALPVTYVPSAVCAHRGGESGTSPQLWSLLMRNKVRLFQRTHGRLESAAFQALLLCGQIARALLGNARARAAVRSLAGPIGGGEAGATG